MAKFKRSRSHSFDVKTGRQAKMPRVGNSSKSAVYDDASFPSLDDLLSSTESVISLTEMNASSSMAGPLKATALSSSYSPSVASSSPSETPPKAAVLAASAPPTPVTATAVTPTPATAPAPEVYCSKAAAAAPASTSVSCPLPPAISTPCTRCFKQWVVFPKHKCSRASAFAKCRYCARLGKVCEPVPTQLRPRMREVLGMVGDRREVAAARLKKDLEGLVAVMPGNHEKQLLHQLRSLNRNVFRLVNAINQLGGLPVFGEDEEEAAFEAYAGDVDEN